MFEKGIYLGFYCMSQGSNVSTGEYDEALKKFSLLKDQVRACLNPLKMTRI